MRILNPEEIMKIRYETDHLTTREAGDLFGVSRTTISNIRRFPRKTHLTIVKEEELAETK